MDGALTFDPCDLERMMTWMNPPPVMRNRRPITTVAPRANEPPGLNDECAREQMGCALDSAFPGSAGGLEEGGFEEFVEFWFSRAMSFATCASSSAMRSSAAFSCPSNSAIRTSRGSVGSGTESLDHAAGSLSIPWPLSRSTAGRERLLSD